VWGHSHAARGSHGSVVCRTSCAQVCLPVPAYLDDFVEVLPESCSSRCTVPVQAHTSRFRANYTETSSAPLAAWWLAPLASERAFKPSGSAYCDSREDLTGTSAFFSQPPAWKAVNQIRGTGNALTAARAQVLWHPWGAREGILIIAHRRRKLRIEEWRYGLMRQCSHSAASPGID
jgi:hypothetical protein